MDEQKQSLTDRIKQAQNILVTVSANPTVDQLAAAIGLTIALNKLDKHGTAVFSGQIPNTIDFLKPEDTLEKNTDSLRDFIIALDKTKADKLRYKVEDQVVRIFITPYKTSLSERDLDFSQGDFNVDVVVALGVTEQQDLDSAITAHGRILHDATVVSVSTQGQGNLGTINWVDPNASSLSEMTVSLVDGLDKKLIDSQIATALLTGIVASTDRFRNERTSPKAMSASAELMAAGANQQLIATELETAVAPAATAQSDQASPTQQADLAPSTPPVEPGTLEIDHESALEPEAPDEPVAEPLQPQVHVDEDGKLSTEDVLPPEISRVRGVDSAGKATESDTSEIKRERIIEPPQLNDGNLTANTQPESESIDPTTEELTLPAIDSPLLTHNETVLPSTPQSETPADTFIPQAPLQPAPPNWQMPQPVAPEPILGNESDLVTPDTTLTQIEQSVDSPHLHTSEPSAPPATNVDDARSAVEAALRDAATTNDPQQPIAALGAHPLGPELHNDQVDEQSVAQTLATPMSSPVITPPTSSMVLNTGFSEPTPGTSPADETLDMPLPSNPFGPGQQLGASPVTPSLPPTPPSAFPGAPQPGIMPSGQLPPPPVPPPMLPPLQ